MVFLVIVEKPTWILWSPLKYFKAGVTTLISNSFSCVLLFTNQIQYTNQATFILCFRLNEDGF